MDFKVGDVVRLKTGGAAMVVETLTGVSREARCVWQERAGATWETHRDVFPFDILTPVGAAAPPNPLGAGEDDSDYKVYEEGDD